MLPQFFSLHQGSPVSRHVINIKLACSVSNTGKGSSSTTSVASANYYSTNAPCSPSYPRVRSRSAQGKLTVRVCVWYAHWKLLWLSKICNFAFSMFKDVINKDLAFILRQIFFRSVPAFTFNAPRPQRDCRNEVAHVIKGKEYFPWSWA